MSPTLGLKFFGPYTRRGIFFLCGFIVSAVVLCSSVRLFLSVRLFSSESRAVAEMEG
jgi:hypothetical protein